MQNQTRIAVFGASGLVGRAVTDALLTKGQFVVHALQRNPGQLAINHANLHSFKVDALIADDIEKALDGVSKVVITVGRDVNLNENLLTQYAEVISKVLVAKGIKQIVLVAGMGSIKIGENHAFDLPDYPPIYINIAKDHVAAINIYESTGIPLTVLCPPVIEDTPYSDQYVIAIDTLIQPAIWKTGNGEISHFILKEIQEQNHVGKRVNIGNK